MSLLDWIHAMIKRQDPETVDMSKEISDIHVRHEAAKKRLDDLTSQEIARLRVLQLQAEVIMRRPSRRG